MTDNSSENQLDNFLSEAQEGYCSYQKITKFDDVNLWLYMNKDHPLYDQRPPQALSCQSPNCSNILKSDAIYNMREMRIAAYSTGMCIDYYSYCDLCDGCKQSVYDWYYNVVWADHPEYKVPNLEIFHLVVE